MLNQRVNVPLRPEEIDGLLALSQREERDPRRQAARLLREGLIRAGVLTESKTAADPQSASAVPA